MYQAPTPLFSVGSKIIRLRHARGGGGAWERGYCHLPPSLFSFTPSPKKRRAEQGLERYEVAKRRRQEKDRTEAADALEALASTTDDVHYIPT